MTQSLPCDEARSWHEELGTENSWLNMERRDRIAFPLVSGEIHTAERYEGKLGTEGMAAGETFWVTYDSTNPDDVRGFDLDMLALILGVFIVSLWCCSLAFYNPFDRRTQGLAELGSASAGILRLLQ